MDEATLVECIEACFDCAQACTACADACLGEENVGEGSETTALRLRAAMLNKAVEDFATVIASRFLVPSPARDGPRSIHPRPPLSPRSRELDI